MRARLIGIGIVAIILAVAVQLRTDATFNVNEAPALSTRPALPINGPVAQIPSCFSFAHRMPKVN